MKNKINETPEVTVDIPETAVVVDVVETVETPKSTLGKVEANKLNVRATPTKDPDNVLGVIERDADVAIDTENSTEEYYKVYTATGLEGFCMKKFIRVES